MTRDGVLLLGGVHAKRLARGKKTLHILGRQKGDQLERVLPQCGTVVYLACSTYKLGSGQGHGVNTMWRIAETVSEPERKKNCHPARAVDVRDALQDISRLESKFAWTPGVSIEEGMRRTCEWLRQQP